MATLLSYADWTKLLCKHFFDESRAGQPVTFFVDDELLGYLAGSGDSDAAAASLADAIRTRAAPDSHGRRFNRIDSECTKWKVDGAYGCPPSLPLLAAAVLAGTRMARESGIGANNYWKRFRDILNLHAENDLKGIRDVLPGLWEQLTWWLDTKNEGRLGRSTVQEDSWWTIIGYALSQALFRESDRQHLTELFRKMGLVPGEEANPAELLQYFKAWAPRSSLSAGARHMAADPRYDVRLSAVLADEASRWDGVLRDDRGRRVGTLIIAYEPSPRPTYTVAAERPTGFPDKASFGSGSFSQELTASVDGWYGETWPLQHDWLTLGLRLEAEEFVLALRQAPVVPLARNRILGCWASVGRVEPGEKYAVLADDGHSGAVATFLGRHALDGWKREAPGFAPAGWALFTGVVIEQSLREIPSGPVSILAPAIRERPTLRGGLLLDGGVGLYLEGGEPDLWLPSLLESDTTVTVDGVEIPASPGERIPLKSRGLTIGNHGISVGASRLGFATTPGVRTGGEVPGSGTVGHRLVRSEDGYAAVSVGAARLEAPLAQDEIAVAGAHLLGHPGNLPHARQTIVLPLSARRYVLLGARPGEIATAVEPERPEWLDTIGEEGLYPIGFEVSADFDVVWTVIEWREKLVAMLRARLTPMTEDRSRPEKEEEWRTAFALDPQLDDKARGLWLEYRAAARILSSDGRTGVPPTPGASPERAAGQPPTRLTAVSSRRRARPTITAAGVALLLKNETAWVHLYETADGGFQATFWPDRGNWKVAELSGDNRALVGTYDNADEAIGTIRRALDGGLTAAGDARMKYELILRWASERGSGTWSQFRETHDWLFNAGRLEGKQTKATTTIHNFSMLGHLEIDWDSGNWAVAPPSLTILPDAGAHALLTGGRTRSLATAFAEAISEADLFSETHAQDWGPHAMYVAAANEEDVEALATRLVIAYETCVSERLAELLPSLDSYLALCVSTPAAHGYGIERFEASLQFRRSETHNTPGLYRYDVWGRPEFRFVDDDGTYYKVDWALGVHAELRRCGRKELRYEPDKVNGTLKVPFKAQLPALHARTAVLCSGLMPQLEGGTWSYPNVPLVTANRIADSLGQALVTGPAGSRT